MKCLKSTAKKDKFVFPSEGLPHRGTIILLPYRLDTWRLNAIPAIENYLEVVKAISKYETVFLGIDNSVFSKYIPLIRSISNVEVLALDYDDAWARDNTPIFVKNNDKIHAVNFGFNAWGGKVDGLYDNWDKDKLLSNQICEKLNIDYYSFPDFILEGGSINTNGKGTLLTTKACLLSSGRNINLSMDEIGSNLKEYLNIDKIIWLNNGIYLDETNEHVDNICAFADESTVLLSFPKDENDIQYSYSKNALDILQSSTTALGNKIKVIKVPSPTIQYMTKEEALSLKNEGSATDRLEGNRLAASYVNFYQGKDFIILPKFNCPEDDEALEIFKITFPKKEIIQIYSREILLGGGNIHCITKEIPYIEN